METTPTASHHRRELRNVPGADIGLDPREREVRRRIAAQELYTDAAPGLDGLEEARMRGKELAGEYNATGPREASRRAELLGKLFGRAGRDLWVEPDVVVSYGAHTFFGDDVFVNTGLTLVDDSEVHIGDRVMLAPRVTITSTGHPVHPELRRDGTQFSAPVIIEDDVWVGAHAVILPGVRVGAGSVVAAGAVVHAHVPPLTVVGGTPARVLRQITEADWDWSWREPRTLAVPTGSEPTEGPGR
ncbi:DapH/DapD/GlmU-related protein [Nesterenkonia sp. K-15-9-6]|uniref:DapH/DapD/GlmU-related protein n=1 Tax=Nesterenkonia sp. K-15-9-6 TaxID=3093918 RepID=UPI004044162D